MVLIESDSETLKAILENIHDPAVLDSHPWVSRPFTRDAVLRNDRLRNARPGEQLIGAIEESFPKIMPSTPPRHGKRLDTRWGEFGILAAQYFAPLQFGTPAPNSLRDAWGRIDQAILLYVYGRNGDSLSESEAVPYILVGDEPEVAPISTLSDWHCKGIQRLADAILLREQYLEKLPMHQSILPAAHYEQPVHRLAHQRSSGNILNRAVRPLLIVLTVFAIIGLVLSGFKIERMYDQALILSEDVAQVQDLMSSSPGLEQADQVGLAISKLREDFAVFKDEAEPLLWLGPWLRWIPIYGGDLAASEHLLKLADLLLDSSERSYAALKPLLTALEGKTNVDPSQMVSLLNKQQPELLQARQTFDEALRLRRELYLDQLSPRMRLLIEQDLDRLMPIMDDGLSAAIALPRLLGAASDGPRTYLILVQNEDELRPTGGFITAAGTLVMENGKVLDLTFTDSGELDNWDKPYPQAPWQLEQYMNSPVLILRDANWFTDFPTTALYAESLYAHHNSYSVDGVIAFNQHMLVLILQALGPIEVEGAPYLIDAESVIPFMRSSKSPPVSQSVPADWSRKSFMEKITNALLGKIFQGEDLSWEKLGKALFEGLNEDHLLLVLDDPAIGEVIARRGWDGALQLGAGDFLMVVDSNIGFNKTNALVEANLVYDVDLTDLSSPTGQLMVTHRNHASADVACIPFDFPILAVEEHYPINACYWNYMRVYTPAGTQLLDASPQIVPDEWMILNHGVPGKVDVLDEEIEGVQAFGTLMVVPGSESLNTGFHFGLPVTVLNAIPGSNWLIYHLDVKKQPGTIEIPLTIRVHLPQGAVIQSTSLDPVVEENHILFQTNLKTDVEINIVFSPK